MKQILFLLASLPLLCAAQNNKGIHFEHGLSWTQILVKAKATNKYIFMDCYTTWCGPCMYMKDSIFPQESVGNFFNNRCINVKVQMDSTGKDNEEVKKWYADTRLIAEKYQINAYPTFLFFSPDGNLVHKMVGGDDADVFIKRASDAFDTSKQYYTLLKRIDNGTTDPELLKTAALAANTVYEQANAVKAANAYVKTQHNLLTKENIEFLKLVTYTSRDTGFKIFLHQPEKVNAVLGSNAAGHITKEIIMNEEVFPKLMDEKGETLLKTPHWESISKTLTKKYPKQAPEIFMYGKLLFYKYTGENAKLLTNIFPYMSKYSNKVSAKELNEFAYTVFRTSNHPTHLQKALAWSKLSLSGNNNPEFMDTYANILYKLGRKPEAIEWEKKVLAVCDGSSKLMYKTTLDRMMNNEKTWED